MLIRIEPESDIPIYKQLTNQIFEGIASGAIRPGDSLPSVRSLAADLGVNMHTVNKSYHELEKKGIIQIAPKSGAMISVPDGLNSTTIPRITAEIRPLIAEALAVGIDQVQINQLVNSIIQQLTGKNN